MKTLRKAVLAQLNSFAVVLRPPVNRAGRLHYLDGMRAVALIIMVFDHGIKSWAAPALWTPLLLNIKWVCMKIPAPMFLFLLGASYILFKTNKLKKGWTHEEIFIKSLYRCAWLLAAAYLYRLVDFFIFQCPWRFVRWYTIDILNLIAISFFIITVADYLLQKFKCSPSWFLAAGFLTAFAGPVFFRLHIPAWVPLPVALYVNGMPPNAYFTVFPYAAYVFFGAYIAAKGWLVRPPLAYRIKLAAFTVISAGLFYFFYAYFSSANLLVACCEKTSFYCMVFSLLLWGGLGCRYFQEKIGFGPLLLFGSNTMAAYWIHAKIIFLYYGDNIGNSAWLTCFVLLLKTYLYTFALTFAYVYLKKAVTSYRGTAHAPQAKAA